MKRLLLSLAVLAAVLSAFGYGLYGVDSAYEKISHQLDLAATYCRQGNAEAAKKCSKKAEEICNHYDLFFHGFISREAVEDVDRALAQLAPLAEKDSLPAFSSKCEETKKILQHLKEAQSVSIKNLF